MTRILFSMLFIALSFVMNGQARVGNVSLKSKRNGESVSNALQGNGEHSRTVVQYGSEEEKRTQPELSDIEKKKIQLQEQMIQIEAKKKEIKTNKPRYREAKRNGSWTKLKSAEKRVKNEMKEIGL